MKCKIDYKMEGKVDQIWLDHYNKLKEFIELNGSPPEPGECETSLYDWFREIRRKYSQLSQYKKKLLSEINVKSARNKYHKKEEWDVMYNRAKIFLAGNKVSVGKRGIYRLKRWIARQKNENKKGALNEWKKELLSEIENWSWGTRHTSWEERYNAVLEFVEKHGRIPTMEENPVLRRWLYAQQKKCTEDRLSPEKLDKFTKLNTVAIDKNKYIWKEKYSELEKFINIHGRLPNTSDGQDDLLEWITYTKRGNLTDEQVDDLEKLPFWNWHINDKKRKRDISITESSEDI